MTVVKGVKWYDELLAMTGKSGQVSIKRQDRFHTGGVHGVNATRYVNITGHWGWMVLAMPQARGLGWRRC